MSSPSHHGMYLDNHKDVTAWNSPFREAMNRLFEESFLGPRFEFFTPHTFPVNIYEAADKQQYVIEAALPGFTPEELQITAVGDLSLPVVFLVLT